jgi:PAS domain S-box-containing protein
MSNRKQNLATGIFLTTDRELKLSSAQDGAELEWNGLAAGELNGKSLSEIFPGAAENGLESALRRVLDGKTAAQLEYEHPETRRRYRLDAAPFNGGLAIFVFVDDCRSEGGASGAEKFGEENLRHLTDLLPVLVSYVDAGRRYRFVNRQYAEWFGVQPSEIVGKTLREFLGAAVYELLEAEIDCALNGERIEFEKLLPYERGGERFVRGRLIPDFDDKRRVRGYFALFEDITERQQIEDSLHDARLRLEATLTTGEIGTWTWDVANDQLIADRNLQRLFSISDEDAAGGKLEKYLAAIHPDDRGRVAQAIADALENKDFYETTYRIAQPNGSARWVIARGRVLRDKTGKPLGLPGVVVDITENKRFEEALRESELFARTLLEASPDCLKLLDAEGRLLYMNPNGLCLMEIDDFEPLRGRFWHELWNAETQPKVTASVEQALREGAARFQEFCPTAKGTPKWWDVMVRAIPGKDGKPVRLLSVSRDITDLKRAEEELLRSREFNQNVIDSLSNHLAVTDKDGTIITVNAAWERFAREHAADWSLKTVGVGDNYLEACIDGALGDDAEIGRRICEGITAVLKGDSDYFAFEYPYRSRAAHFWFLLTVVPLRGESGSVVISHQDITERKRAEEALRESERFNQEVIDSLPTHIAVLDRNGAITAVNAAWRRFALENGADWTMKSVGVGANYLQVCQSAKGADEPDGNAIRAGLSQILDGELDFFSIEYPCHSPTERRWFLMTAAPLKSKGAGAVISHLNITERRLIEEKLRESEEQFRTLANSIPQLAWMADETGAIFWYNERWYEYTGKTLEEMRGWGWQAVHDPEILPKVMRRWTKSIITGKPFEMEFPLRRADGEFRWFLTRVLPIRDSEGRITRWFGTNTDIEEIRSALRAAEEASRLKDDFLATVSHELRTPLNAILGWSQMLESGKIKDAAQIARANETIYRNARSQAQLIEDILDVSRIITGKLRVEMQPVSFVSIVKAAADTVRPAIEAKSIALELDLDESADLIYGDADRLQQVVWNLLSNAVKFSPNRGKVTVKLENLDSHLRLTVTDEGRGIEKEFLPFIFDRFRQADASSTRRHGGLGLGLSIVRHLVELHGGSVSALSEGEGKGATFIVRLPLLWKPAAEAQTTEKNAAELVKERPPDFETDDDCPSDLRFRRVLLVDDEADTLAVIEAALIECHAEVRTATSAAQAFEIFKQWRPELVVSDIAMPDEDGYSLIKKIRALDSAEGGETPAIALTAYARLQDRETVLAAGFQKHLAKPVELPQLLKAADELLN